MCRRLYVNLCHNVELKEPSRGACAALWEMEMGSKWRRSKEGGMLNPFRFSIESWTAATKRKVQPFWRRLSCTKSVSAATPVTSAVVHIYHNCHDHNTSQARRPPRLDWQDDNFCAEMLESALSLPSWSLENYSSSFPSAFFTGKYMHSPCFQIRR